MGIAKVEPRQLAPTVGMMGSGSTDSLAPSPTIADLTAPTRFDGSSSATDVDSAPSIDINIASSTADIDIGINIDTAPPTIIGIAVPTIINATSSATMVNITGSTIIDITSPSIANLTPARDFDSTAATTIDPISSLMGAISARSGGFDMAFGLFNFHMGSNGAAELISISESTPLVADPSTPSAAGGNTLTTTSPMPLEEEPRLETSTPSVGSNDFQDPPPSPTTTYCVECDAYHFVGARDFSAHDIAGYEDPRGGTTTIYSTIVSANGLSTPSCSNPHPMTLITSKGYIWTTHALGTMSILRPKERSATQLVLARVNTPYQAANTWSIMTPTP
jgi:hypothetical protein